ncbi:protein XRP2 [Pelomyxa schiedti]|nr:protein XRP2 [Pelomyxa schiedti]
MASNPYLVTGLGGGTLVRCQGSLAGKQFLVRKCLESVICICDHTCCTTVDDCTNCKFFVGPVEGSFFIRNCKDCIFVVACQQFRAKGCQGCSVMLFCETSPSLEDSLGMQFGCFRGSYPGILEHFSAANMDVFKNDWSSVNDFTPNKTVPNWSFLHPNVGLPVELSAFPDPIGQQGGNIVPLSWGKRPLPHEEIMKNLLVVPFSNTNDALHSLHELEAIITIITMKKKPSFSKSMISRTLSVTEGTQMIPSELFGSDTLGIAFYFSDTTIPEAESILTVTNILSRLGVAPFGVSSPRLDLELHRKLSSLYCI